MRISPTPANQVGLHTGPDGGPISADELLAGLPLVGQTEDAEPVEAVDQELLTPQSRILGKGLGGQRPQKLTYSAPDEQGTQTQSVADSAEDAKSPYAGVGRNQLCPCGSGKKFKACHGRNPGAA